MESTLIFHLRWPWQSAHRAIRLRNQVLLMDTELLVPIAWVGRFKPGKAFKLHFTFDASLQLARVCVKQGYQSIGQLPLPDAQQLYLWQQQGVNYSLRLLETGKQYPESALRLRITRP
jgi:hypothetical protein